MVYTGKVVVGGRADVRELPQLIVSKIAVGEFDNNAYLLRCRRTGSQLLIDAASDAPALLSLIGPDGIGTVVTTHLHRDHWQALAEVVAATGAEHVTGEIDAAGIDVPAGRTVTEGDVIGVGDVGLEVIHLVGHTDGSIALLYDDPDGPPHLFTGDCLFPGGVGNTWGDSSRFDDLLNGVETKVFGRLPDETWIYPGHGGDTTLGAERPHLQEWWDRGW